MNLYESASPDAKQHEPSTEDMRNSLRDLWRKIEALPGFREKSSDYAASIEGSQILIHDEDGNLHLAIWQSELGEFVMNHNSGPLFGGERDMLEAVADFVTLREIEYFATDAKIDEGKPMNMATNIVMRSSGHFIEVNGILIFPRPNGMFDLLSGKAFRNLYASTVKELIWAMK